MKRREHCRQPIWWTLAIGIGSVVGCQGLDRSSSHYQSAAPERPAPISMQQAADVHVAMGRTLEKRGEWERALSEYQEAVRRDPSRVDAHLRLATLYDRQGKFAESAEEYQRASEAEPGNPDVYCDLGYSLYLQRRWADAETNLVHALTIKRDHQRAHNNLGLVLAQTDRSELALTEFTLGGASEAEAHANLAFVLMMNQRWDEARQQYEVALSTDPRCQAASDGLNHLKQVLARSPAGRSSPSSALNTAFPSGPMAEASFPQRACRVPASDR